MFCPECCLTFGIVNRNAEIKAGLRKKSSEIESAAAERAIISEGIGSILSGKFDEKNPSVFFIAQVEAFQDIEKKLKDLGVFAKPGEILEATEAADREQQAQCVNVESLEAAMGKAAARHGDNIPFTRTHGTFTVAPPTQSSLNIPEDTVCSECGGCGSVKLMLCGRCRSVCYCSKECQAAAWKTHKRECRQPDDTTTGKLPLTWSQLEGYNGMPAVGKVLEVRIMKIDTYLRKVLHCEDRVGAVRLIAVYSDNQVLPGAAVGRMIRWTGPRFRNFMDGRSGARAENYDLGNIKITDT